MAGHVLQVGLAIFPCHSHRQADRLQVVRGLMLKLLPKRANHVGSVAALQNSHLQVLLLLVHLLLLSQRMRKRATALDQTLTLPWRMYYAVRWWLHC